MTVVVSSKGGRGGASRPGFKVMLFDLDDTLYRNHLVPEQVRHSIEEFMVTKLGVPQADVKQKCTQLYMKYGTTLAGLVAEGFRVDFDDWHRHVHYGTLDYNSLLKPDPSLRALLMSIDLPKHIVTNADRKHAELCLDRLGIRDCFSPHFFDFEDAQRVAAECGLSSADKQHVLCKPQVALYKAVLEQAGVQPNEAIFFDDSIRNLASAHELGMFTVLVGQKEPMGGANLALPDMHALAQALPDLLDQPGIVHDDRSSKPQLVEVRV